MEVLSYGLQFIIEIDREKKIKFQNNHRERDGWMKVRVKYFKKKENIKSFLPT
jgi:hypothetical protein